MSRALRAVALVAIATTFAGCASDGLYSWGSYEESVYRVCEDPEGFDRAANIDRLTTIVERAAAKERRVAPGVHAHLGYLHYMNGDADTAIAAFLAEKDAYPESTVFVDGMVERIQGSSR